MYCLDIVSWLLIQDDMVTALKRGGSLMAKSNLVTYIGTAARETPNLGVRQKGEMR